MNKSTLHTFFIFLFIFIITDFFCYVNIDIEVMGRVKNAIFIFLFLISFICINRVGGNLNLKRHIIWMVIAPLFSLITVLLYYQQSILESRSAILGLSIFLLYFVFVIYEVHPNSILNAFVLCGIIVLFLQVFQQFIPDEALFGVFNEDQMYELESDTAVHIRNGIYRFRLDPFFYVTVLSLFIYWEKVQMKFNIRNFIFFILFFASTYLYLARQILFVVLLVIIMSMLFNRKHIFKLLIFSLFLGLVTYYNYELLFENLVESAIEDSSDDYIRNFEFLFFISKILQNPLTFLFGNGHIIEEVAWRIQYHYYTADIGLIGTWYYYGLIWIVAFLYMMFRIILRFRKYIPLYLIMFIWFVLIDSILISPIERYNHTFVLMCVIYIIEWNLIQYKEHDEEMEDNYNNENTKIQSCM